MANTPATFISDRKKQIIEITHAQNYNLKQHFGRLNELHLVRQNSASFLCICQGRYSDLRNDRDLRA